jgi:hypothetical protein
MTSIGASRTNWQAMLASEVRAKSRSRDFSRVDSITDFQEGALAVGHRMKLRPQ